MENPIQRVENAITPTSLIQQALELKVDTEQLNKLMEMQIRWEDRNARKAFVEALAKFRMLCPPIYKTKKAGFTSKRTGGDTSYSFADLSNVLDVVKPIEIECELNHTFKTEQVEKGVKVTCIITHIAGHSEEAYLIAPPDLTGNKNPIQAIGSTVFYLERYTFFAVTGLAAQEIDDDGAGVNTEKPLPKSQEFLLDTALRKAFDNFVKATKKLIPKGGVADFELFKAELRTLKTALKPDEKAKFKWDEIGINKLVASMDIKKIITMPETKKEPPAEKEPDPVEPPQEDEPPVETEVELPNQFECLFCGREFPEKKDGGCPYCDHKKVLEL